MATDEFYIGYQSNAPQGLAGRMRIVAGGIVAAAAGLAVLAASQQQRFDEGVFEFGVVKEFEGVLLQEPLPHLRLTRAQGDHEVGALFLLVSQGKHGFPDYATPGFGKRVRCSGSLIHQGDTVMLEMAGADTFQVIGLASDRSSGQIQLGEVTLTGELVDSKCFLGVMRPGAGKVHRACASNCLRGGIPPAILVRTVGNADVAILLAADENGKWNIDYQWAGRTVRAQGLLSQYNGVPILDAATIELLP